MSPKSLTERGPEIFIGAGLFLLSLAAYIAGGDQLTCRYFGASVTCDVDRKRIFGFYTSDHAHAEDIVTLSIKSSTTTRGTQASARSGMVRVSTNETLVATTRANHEIPLLGGEAATNVIDSLAKLVEGERIEPVTYYDSYAIVAGAVAVMGLVFFVFGAMALHFEDA